VAWTRSGWHGAWFYYGLEQVDMTHSLDHPMAVALYGNTVTPDGHAEHYAGYGRGCWERGELDSPPGWPAGGTDIPGGLSVAAIGDLMVVAGLPAAAGPATLTPHGSMIYDRAATTGLRPLLSFLYHYFGGPIPCTDGAFRIIWSPDGVAVMTAPLAEPLPLPLAAS
jgi:hypothetical protein